MCPIGATHIPIQGIAKIARKLGIDFGEAVVELHFYISEYSLLRDFLILELGWV
jgi:hypothetical protein